MQELSESYLESATSLLPRRYGLKADKIFLYGAPGVGKTSLALLHSEQYKNALFVDCADSRFCPQTANTVILKAYLERRLELLIVDNYTPHISLPNIPCIILIDKTLASCPKDFTPKAIRALSFEEYVSFDKKNLSIKHLFNTFLKEGNLAEIHSLAPHRRIPRKQEILKIALSNDFSLFCSMLPLQAKIFSVHHLYQILKKTHKISKDKIYPLLHYLEEWGIIYRVPHTKHNHKKLYFYDFTLPLCVSGAKNLQAMLENMLFLEILNFCERYGLSEAVSYGDMGEFICELGVFVFLAFATYDSIESKLAKCGIEGHIYVITFEFEGNGSVNTQSGLLKWEAISFINFALEFNIS